MTAEYRFRGAMSEEYSLIRLAIPGFEELQAFVGKVISRYEPDGGRQFIEVLEIGCGDGVTSATILSSRRDCLLTALDSEESMIEHMPDRSSEGIEDHFWVKRIEAGQLWLEPFTAGRSEIGPIPVPNKVTQLCQTMWEIGGVVAKTVTGLAAD